MDNSVNMVNYKIIFRVVLQTKERDICLAFDNYIDESYLIKRATMVNEDTLDNLFLPYQCRDISYDGKNIISDVNFGVVNAWDTFSWIGNGGSRDNSIDGFYVSGLLTGKTFINNSYLLNRIYTNNFTK